MRTLAVLAVVLLSACTAAPQTPEQARQRERERAFAICGGCHTAHAGGVHRFGPNLHGVIGRRAGSLSDYPYSPAMRRANLVWSEQSLDAFLRSPTSVVPDSRMVNSTADPERRKLVIEYLGQQRAP